MENINLIVSQFNNREYAIVIWFFIIISISLAYKKWREIIFSVPTTKVFWDFFILITSCNLLLIYSLYSLWHWDINLFKTTLYWFLWWSIIMFMSIEEVDKWFSYIKYKIYKAFSLTTVFIFVTNIYVFPLVLEFILQPVLFTVILMTSFLKRDEYRDKKYNITKNIFNGIQILLWILIIWFVFGKLITDFTLFFNKENINNFIYPVVYFALFYPYLYFVRLIMNYESLFVRLKIANGNNKKDYISTRWKIINFCGLSLKKLNNFSKHKNFRINDKQSIEDIIENYKT